MTIFQADENDLENDDITLLPARLEYYDSEKKWREGAHPKKRIVLTDCFDINRKKETANQFVIAVYTLNEGLDILFENDQVSSIRPLCGIVFRNKVICHIKMVIRHMWRVANGLDNADVVLCIV